MMKVICCNGLISFDDDKFFFKGFKSGESERSVVIITLRWEGYVKDEIREFCHYGMEAISNLKVNCIFI